MVLIFSLALQLVCRIELSSALPPVFALSGLTKVTGQDKQRLPHVFAAKAFSSPCGLPSRLSGSTVKTRRLVVSSPGLKNERWRCSRARVLLI